MTFWWYLTDFGDSAVTLPLALAVILALLAGRRWRTAFLWAGCVGASAAATGGIKLLMKTCHGPLFGLALVTPSGHTAMSTAVYGGLALLTARHLPGRRGNLTLLGAALLAPGIGLSRIVIGAHTVPEVTAGLMIGLAALAALHRWLPREDPFTLPLAWLAGTLGVVLAASYGNRWPIEDLLHEIATLLQGRLPACG